MESSKNNSEIIRSLKEKTQCLKDFKCLDGDFKGVCKALRLVGDDIVECEMPSDNSFFFHNTCNNIISFGGGYYCKCPIRKYLLENSCQQKKSK